MEGTRQRALLSLFSIVAQRIRGTYYGWWLVPVTGFTNTINSVPLFHSMGLWFVALESAFGWNRIQLSIAFSLTRIEGGILGPIEGWMVDRVGTRRMVLIGLTIMGGGFLFMSQVQSLWMFYVAFLIMALGQGLGGWLPLNAMLNNWFSRSRSTAMGWSAAVAKFGAICLIPVIAWAVDPEGDTLGWSLTAIVIGILAISLAFPISRIIRNRPEDYGLLPDNERPEDVERRRDRPARATALSPTTEFTASQALRTRTFWLIAIGHGFTSMAIIAIMAHLAPMLTDQGLTLIQAAWVGSTYNVFSMIFQVIGGYIGDRIPKNVGLFIFTMVQAASLLVLTFATQVWMAFAFAVLFGIGFGGRSPLATSIRGEYFGRRSFGTIMGISQVPMNVLLLAAPVFPGIIHERYDSYTLAFLILAGLNSIGGFLFLLARKPTLPQTSRRREVSPSGRRNGNPLGYIIGSARRRRGEGATAQRTQATGAESPRASRGPAVGDGQE